jgi:hypothetical protein
MLSEIDMPPSTAATPRMTPSDWRIERVRSPASRPRSSEAFAEGAVELHTTCVSVP